MRYAWVNIPIQYEIMPMPLNQTYALATTTAGNTTPFPWPGRFWLWLNPTGGGTGDCATSLWPSAFFLRPFPVPTPVLPFFFFGELSTLAGVSGPAPGGAAEEPPPPCAACPGPGVEAGLAFFFPDPEVVLGRTICPNGPILTWSGFGGSSGRIKSGDIVGTSEACAIPSEIPGGAAGEISCIGVPASWGGATNFPAIPCPSPDDRAVKRD